jgi:hypothetical protein
LTEFENASFYYRAITYAVKELSNAPKIGLSEKEVTQLASDIEESYVTKLLRRVESIG